MPPEWTEVVEDVYDITIDTRYGRRYRVFLLDADVPTLVDAGFEDTVDVLVARLDEIGLTPERLVVTHSDPDHVGGFDGVREAYDLETWLPAASGYEPRLPADHRFADGDRIGALEAVHVPGHTPDSFAFVDDGRGLAVMGDTIYGSDIRGLPAGYPIAPAAGLTDDPHAAERNLAALLDYDFDVALVYHGSSILEDARDRLADYVEYPGSELAHY